MSFNLTWMYAIEYDSLLLAFAISLSQVKFLDLRRKRNYRRLVSRVSKAPFYRMGWSGSIPGWTNTAQSHGLKIIEKALIFALTSASG